LPYEQTPARARLARDAALARLRRLSGVAVGIAVLLSGVFAGVAASGTHPRKTVRRLPTVRPRSQTVPPLPPARPPSAGSLAPPPAPPEPAVPASPPVAVSGGS